jgi:hypothetical protein
MDHLAHLLADMRRRGHSLARLAAVMGPQMQPVTMVAERDGETIAHAVGATDPTEQVRLARLYAARQRPDAAGVILLDPDAPTRAFALYAEDRDGAWTICAYRVDGDALVRGAERSGTGPAASGSPYAPLLAR